MTLLGYEGKTYLNFSIQFTLHNHTYCRLNLNSVQKNQKLDLVGLNWICALDNKLHSNTSELTCKYLRELVIKR